MPEPIQNDEIYQILKNIFFQKNEHFEISKNDFNVILNGF